MADPPLLATPLLRLATTLPDLEDQGALEEATGPEMRTAGRELRRAGQGPVIH